MDDERDARGKKFSAAEQQQYLSELDDELDGHKRVLLVVIGGAALSYMIDRRLSDDMDVINDALDDEIKSAVARVAERHDLRPDWVNDAARMSSPNIKPTFKTVFNGRNIEVLVPDNRYLLATKLNAKRGTDFDDAVELAVRLGLGDVESLLDILEQGYPRPFLDLTHEYFATSVAEAAKERIETAKAGGEPQPDEPL